MRAVNTSTSWAGVIFSSLLATVLLSGCDRPGDMPKRPDVPEQQQLGNYTPPKSPTQRDDDSIAPTVPASEHDLDGQAQQTQDQDRDRNITEDSDEARQFALVKKAVADVKPTARYEVTGTVTFSPGSDSKSMNIQIALSGLTPGQHGLHIHQNGSCSSDDAASAGPHFNPYQMPHGAPQVQSHHAGDLGNVEADAEGRVNTTLTMPELAFSGPTSVLDKSIIVHAQADDLQTDPAGNSGDRAGCGVIRPDPPDVLAGSKEGNASNNR